AQTPPQFIVPAPVQVHWPLTHCPPASQRLPQRPQFCGSLDTSVQPESHANWPIGQWQAPETQLEPLGQASWQEPQCSGSEETSTHRLTGQMTPGVGQVAMQLPPTQ